MGKNGPGRRIQKPILESRKSKGTLYYFFGRRKGHKLSSARQNMLEEFLPRLLIPTFAADKSLDPALLFQFPVSGVWMEIGFGAGEHLAYQAKRNPNIGFLGIEPFVNGLAALISVIKEQDINNIRVLNDDVRLLLDNLAPNSLDRVFILFPDPWPKKKHHRRRLFSHGLLDQLNYTMKCGSELQFATDDGTYVQHVLRIISNRTDFKWEPTGPTDWRVRPFYSIETRYEAKARQGNRLRVYLNFKRC